MPNPFATPDEFIKRYSAWQEKVHGFFFAAAEKSGMDKATINAIFATAPSNDALFDVMKSTKEGYDEVKRLNKEFRNTVLDFNHAFTEDSWHPVGKGGGDKIVGRFVHSGPEDLTDNPLAYMLRRLSIQKDETLEGLDQFSFGNNIPRYDFFNNLRANAGKKIEAGKRIFIFDSETLGLAQDASNVREISSAMMNVTDGGFSLDATQSLTRHMNVTRAAFGAIRDPDTGKLIRMDNYIKKHLVGDAPIYNNGGAGFIDAARPFLEQMRDADYIAGHNVAFDIGQVVTNARKTGDYLNNTRGIKSLVDDVAAKLNTPAILDTLEMSSEYFGNKLGLAPELAAMGKPSSFSLENIMLQTNLGELLKNDESIPGFYDKLLKSGQHQAEIDTTITAKLIEFIQTKALKDIPTKDLALRRNVVTSRALTPISNIADISQVTPDMFRRLIEEGGDSVRIHKLGTEKMIEDLSTLGTPEELHARLMSGETDMFASMKVTPLEQLMVAGRKVFNINEDVVPVADNLGQWQDFSKYGMREEGFLNRLGDIFKRGEVPTDEAFGEFQQRMATSNMPFAGISMPERVLTSGLSNAGVRNDALRGMLSPNELRAAEYGNDLGINRWLLRSEFNNAPSGVASIPLEVIRAAEAAEGYNVGTHIGGGGLQKFSLSTVDSTKDINLMLNLGEDESHDLMRFVSDVLGSEAGSEHAALRGELINKHKLNEVVLEEMKENLFGEKKMFKSGINVGVSHEGHPALSDMLQGATRDADKIPYSVGLMDVQDGYLRAGAVVEDRFQDADFKAAYIRDLEVAKKRSATLGEELADPVKLMKAKWTQMLGDDRIAMKGEQVYNAIKKKGPVALGAAALVFGGYYAYNKHKKQKEYDETMQDMSYEGQPEYDQYRREMNLSPAPAQRTTSLDPLSYAGLVGNLHRGAIGHTVMGAGNRNAGLFVGV